jgi:hypothetical protein
VVYVSNFFYLLVGRERNEIYATLNRKISTWEQHLKLLNPTQRKNPIYLLIEVFEALVGGVNLRVTHLLRRLSSSLNSVCLLTQNRYLGSNPHTNIHALT